MLYVFILNAKLDWSFLTMVGLTVDRDYVICISKWNHMTSRNLDL